MTEGTSDSSETDVESQVNSTDEQQEGTEAVGTELSTASVSSDYKVRGKKASASGTGVQGHNTATTGTAHGVEGITDSDSSGAAGVYGKATKTSGAIYGVKGFSNSEGFPVQLQSQSSSTDVGTASSSSGLPAGVRGKTHFHYGVLGRADDPESSLSLPDTPPGGVYGITNLSNGSGVIGWSFNSDGVYAVTDDSSSSGLLARNRSGGTAITSNGDAKVNGSLSVTNNVSVLGHTDVSKVGLSAYLDSDQKIPTSTSTTVVFNKTNTDDFSGYDTSTGVYTVQKAGDYHVSFTIDWTDFFDEGDTIQYKLLIDGSTSGQGFDADTDAATTDQNISECFSRTLFGLSSGDKLSVELEQDSGSDKFVFGSNQETYLTIYKVG